MAYVDPQKLYYQQFIRREHNARRHKYNEELKMYNLIKAGDMSSMEDNMRLFVSSKVGHLSDNPLQDKKYLFVLLNILFRLTKHCKYWIKKYNVVRLVILEKIAKQIEFIISTTKQLLYVAKLEEVQQRWANIYLVA